MTSATGNADRITSVRRWSALVAVVGGVVSIGFGVWQPTAFWPAYLVAVLFVLGIGLGCLAVSLLHRLTGGRWGMSVLREMTAAVGTIPLASLLLLPIIPGAAHLYPFLNTEQSVSVLNEHQQEYFDPSFWIGRGAAYLIVWIGLGLFTSRGYRRMCHTNEPQAWHSKQRLSAIGLILFWLTVTFAAMDWVMSLEPQWTSTIYGAMLAMGFVISGWSLAIVMRHWLGPETGGTEKGSDPLDRAASTEHNSTKGSDPFSTFSRPSPEVTHDLGNMLLAFLLVWVYLSFSQFLIIWSGDLPHEITWYQRRTAGVWSVVGTGLLVFHFAVPFGLLLSRERKRDLRRLAHLATGLLVMRLVDLTWTVLPAFDEALAVWIFLLPVTVATLSGAWLWAFLWQWQRLPELDVHVMEPSAREAESARVSREVTS